MQKCEKLHNPQIWKIRVNVTFCRVEMGGMLEIIAWRAVAEREDSSEGKKSGLHKLELTGGRVESIRVG